MSEHNDELRFLLQNLQAESDEIQGLSLISVQGLPIVSIMDESISETLTSAMAAAIQSVGERAADELKTRKVKTYFTRWGSRQFIINRCRGACNISVFSD